MSAGDSYPLGYSDNETHRLEAQAAYLEDQTSDVLRRAGIGPCMRVLDLGCGIGDVSLLAAAIVGRNDSVLGIDRSGESVEVARRRAAARHIPNARFEIAELDTFEPAETFDAVVGRLVLLYQRNPVETLRRFAGFLRPGGIMAFQEIDVDMSREPPSELSNKVRHWIVETLKAGGAETRMGSKLLRTFLDAGLPRPAMTASCRVESGPDSAVYDHHASIVRSLLPLAERAGLTTASEVEVDTLADRLRQEAIELQQVTFESRMVGAWCQRIV
jgi:2-polyprenyl-3-methyl-5-hydroxy-6-metoxy-1,4-benzoquinol methylase